MESRSEFGICSLDDSLICIESDFERNSQVLDSLEDTLEGQNSSERLIVEHSDENTRQMYANESLTPVCDITDEEDKITPPVEHRKNNLVNYSTTPRFLLKYCQFIEKHLCISFAATLGLHTSIVLTTILLIVKSYNIFPISFQDLPLVLYNDTSHTQDLAWRYAMQYKNRVIHPIFGLKPRKQLSETLELIFEGGDIFSEINMKLLNETESKLFYRQDYQAKFCYPSIQNDCEKPISVLRLFDGTYTDVDRVFNSGSFKNASSIICKAVKNNKTRVFLLPLLEKDYDPCDANKRSSKTRLFMLFSWKSKEHYNENTYREYLSLKIQKEVKRLQDEVLDAHMSVFYYSIKMYLYDVYREAFRNMKLAIGSFLFIFMFMWFQTKSFWITFFGILSIFTSFLLTNLIYRFVLQYRYFGFFHIISVFIILGIGADDIFIFYDTWILSKHTRYPSKAHRLADCYLKAAKTTFVTSLTTMAAFLVSAPSPLLPVASFGIFTGMLVGVNFLFDLTCFPIVILFHSEVITPCFVRLIPCSRKTLSVRTESHDRLITSLQNRTSSDNNDCSRDVTYHQLQLQDEVNEENETKIDTAEHSKKRNKVVWFLENKFYNFMIWKPVRIVIPLTFLIITAFFTYSATTLEADSSQVKIYRESNNYAKAIERHFSWFQQNYDNSYNRLHLTWGMKPQNMQSCDWKSGDSCKGQSEIDGHFDMSSSEAQISLMNLCRLLENFTDEEITSYGIKRNPVTNKPEIACFISALHKFIQNTGYLENIPFPFTNESVVPFMRRNFHIYNISSVPANFNRYFEILVSYWLSNGYTHIPTEDFLTYHRLIGETTIPGVTQHFNRSSFIGTYGTRLRVIAIEINTTFTFQNIGYREGKPIYHLWEKFIQQEVSKMPSSMKSGFQSTYESWHWIKLQETLVKSAVRGVVIGISLAFPILTLTTLNVVIGFLATICITMITVVVVGLIPLIGWKLGVLESINLSLIVGLSVDYVVHFAEAYRTSPFTHRKDRVKSMLEGMGLSVLSGAITTFGAAVFMLFAEIQFSYQFGIFVMCTIGTSFLFSFLLFPAFMASFGPEGDSGSIPAIVKAIKLRYHRKQEYMRVNCDETYDSDIELLS
ncbi:protein dispatched homolog 1-like [Mytilus californianus]|uniref:protein dispatched homolog 1-like n=1 Tax=Mytilus californianus TaxID=6549 RepID=UPI002246BC1D|nr:protein dispatched homolog 1-like [Mytilus californianus]